MPLVDKPQELAKALGEEACNYSDHRDPLNVPNSERLATVLSALGDPIRLQLISIIARAENKEVCACSFVGDLDRAQPTVSHHLKTLTKSGICKAERRGRWIWYSLNHDLIQETFTELSQILGDLAP